MKLVRFTEGEKTRIVKVVGGDVIDLSGVRGVGSSIRQLLTDFRERAPRVGSCSGRN